MSDLTRRQVLEGAILAPLVAIWQPPAFAQPSGRLDRAAVEAAPSRVVGVEGESLPQVQVVRTWNGAWCQSRIVNRGRDAARIGHVVLFDVSHALPAGTRLYGEGFQMLTQTGGTLGAPADLGNYTDPNHYKLAAPAGARSVYGLLTLHAPDGAHYVLAFTSCRRFSGRFDVRTSSVQAVVDAEGLALKPGEEWLLEELTYDTGPDREKLLSDLAARLNVNHPPLRFAAPPAGWCSWYCFGPRVTAQNVRDNLEVIAKQIPVLEYIQIDDGYQPAMGDWLETGAAFGGDVRKVLDEIRKKGFQPAIWVAPFVAEEGSHVFQQHRDWFVKDTDGSPLRSDKVSFGGWRKGPWYVLDGTHPGVHAHFEHVFSTMRKEWGVTYFKLDANFWGAIHGGRFHDPDATRVEAYRRGMQAILRGAGDSFILGCNHPIWPSVGLIHGSRSSNDIKRTWDRIRTTAQQNLLRNWQNGRLWWNDPDAIVLTGELPEHEFLFHATAIYATGGMLLSGDDLTVIPDARMAMLKKMLPPTGVPAVFDDEHLRVGTVTLPGKRMVCLFNWTDAPMTLSTRLLRPSRVTDFWTGQSLGRQNAAITITDMPAHSARLLECVDV